MTLDPRYVLLQDPEMLFVDKATGLPLANGTVEFYQDNQRSNPKPVYQLTGAPPNYTYTQLPNPLPLSIIGTPSTTTDDNIAIYWYPYDAFGNIELYYIVVKDSNGVVQFTREAWPNVFAGEEPGDASDNTATNLLSNGQWVDVNFDASAPLVLTFAALGIFNIPIAPDWTIVFTTFGASTLTIERKPQAGTTTVPTNPPYTLAITPGINTTSVQLVQTLPDNPAIWAGTWLSTSITMVQGTAMVFYIPQPPVTQTLLVSTTALTGPQTFTTSTFIPAASNTAAPPAGFTDISITLSPTGTTELTSLQIVSTSNVQNNIPYNQQPVNRQNDYLAHYYIPKLAYKPIPSYLIGWDFPLNPAQIFGNSGGPSSAGINTSAYTWDQTIIFQTVNNGYTVSRGTNGNFVVTAQNNGQIALIQYLDRPAIQKLLQDKMAVHIAATTSRLNGLAGKVTLWVTDDSNVTTAANTSLVSALDLTGFPTCSNGTWTQITRGNLGDAAFTLPATSSTNDDSLDIDLSFWNLAGAAIATNAKFFAIVVGFAPMTAADTISFNSISLCPGDIATRPAPLGVDETYRLCERYYEKSYQSSDLAGTVTTFNYRESTHGLRLNGGNTIFTPSGFGIEYRAIKRLDAPTITMYSPSAGTANRVDAFIRQNNSVPSSTVLTFTTSWGNAGLGNKSCYFNPLADGATLGNGNLGSAYIQYHYVIDARIGIV